MSEVAQVAALVCALAGKPPECRLKGIRPRTVAAHILKAVKRHPSVTPEEAALMLLHESRFNPDARGAGGELGMAQLYRGKIATRGYNRLTDRQLMNPELNIRLGVRHLALVKADCSGAGKPVSRWIGRYSGAPCGRTRYGRLAAKQLGDAHKILRRHGVVLASGGP